MVYDIACTRLAIALTEEDSEGLKASEGLKEGCSPGSLNTFPGKYGFYGLLRWICLKSAEVSDDSDSVGKEPCTSQYSHFIVGMVVGILQSGSYTDLYDPPCLLSQLPPVQLP